MTLSSRRILATLAVGALALCSGCTAQTGEPAGVGDLGGPATPSDPSGPSGPVDPGEPPASTDPIAAAILSLHNAARASASPAPSPALPALGWSDAAASAAQAWANGCVWPHDPKLGSLGMGQNVYASCSGSPSVAAKPADVVGSWVSEAAYYHYDANSCDSGQQCGHYTAVVWRSTTAVGCGHHVCSTGSPCTGFKYWDFWVCNYVPPGNWVGKRPY